MAFNYTSGNPDNLVGDQPAAMQDIRGPFGDIKSFLNSGVLDPIAGLTPPQAILSSVTVNEVGVSGQVRAGRQLAATDFTGQGLAVPLGLWNLSDLTDASGNGRALTNKGSVPFGVGINGAATTAAQFAGSTGQALYIADTGAADPFRIKTGSWGCWFRTAKRGTSQYMGGKYTGTAAVSSYSMGISSGNLINVDVTAGGAIITAVGTSDVCDDRWHHLIVTYDATRVRIYVDGALDGSLSSAVGSLNASATAPFNIGGLGADGSTAAALPFYGRVDEAFVTADVLSEEQIRNLYAARVTHTLGQSPGRVNLLVRRRRRGGALVTGDFPTTPTRLHPFSAGSLNDLGSGGVALTSNPGTGAIVAVADADGSSNGAYSFSGAHTGLSATDAGLPSGTASRSYGCWFKGSTLAFQGLLGWGTITTGEARLDINSTGNIRSLSNADILTGPVVADGLWHHAVATEDNAAADGVKRKLYVDGRLVGGSTVLNAVTLAGANRFRVGANPDGTAPFTGQIDDAFVYAGALTAEQVRVLYNKGSQQLAASPKDATDHVEAVTGTDVLVVMDTIEASDAVDLVVAP